ncbi:PQ loop repeat protein [Aspergillus sclerotialis]|uniref:PQ loop repeat protein n=1 Tax=Aspergillus sclerotialis TaxID=2070753 RepID=A0A3A3A9M2_9EURO|nr:PQ loop repeat protein [Aspergillus sclerotialis]
MIILAVYYTLADIVLLGQCFYYRGFTLRDEVTSPVPDATRDDMENHTPASSKVTEQTSLLPKTNGHSHQQSHVQSYAGRDHQPAPSSHQAIPAQQYQRRHSAASFRDILHPSVDGTHLSPATPLIEPSTKVSLRDRNISAIQSVLFNGCAIILVCAAGVLGWYVSPGSKAKHRDQPDGDDTALHFDLLGQVFGYLCAVFYLGSRLPQILLNFRRKSTDGVSLLFFLFACIGNLTYVLSILAYSPTCGPDSGKNESHCRPGDTSALYARYILVNLSWLLGSFGTLLLDMCIFAQFFLYKDNVEDEVIPPL